VLASLTFLYVKQADWGVVIELLISLRFTYRFNGYPRINTYTTKIMV